MPPTLSETTYQRLKDEINTLVLSANEFLNEQQLAQRYGISKAPIRSALHRLCMEGILVSYPRKGYLIVTLNEDEFQQVQALRTHNECFALDLLARHASPQQLNRLMEIASGGRSAKDNLEFHTTLGRMTGNRFLEDIIEKLLSQVTRTFSMHSFNEEINTFAPRHAAIVAALIEGDVEKAKCTLRADIIS